jgi:hypothetical protein
MRLRAKVHGIAGELVGAVGHPKVTKLSPGRQKKSKQYLDLFPDRSFWEKAIAEIERSTFLRGHRNGAGHEWFKADFDWLLSKGKDGTENVVKVAEGKYRDAGHGHNSKTDAIKAEGERAKALIRQTQGSMA